MKVGRRYIMGKKILFTFLGLAMSSAVFAQSGTGSSGVQGRADDAFRELNEGKLTLRFVNALTGDYVEGAQVIIGQDRYMTDGEGKVVFETDLVNGSLPVTFRKAGFITSDFSAEIMVGSIFQNQVSVSPELRPEQIRIVLDWADRPRDLDAHFYKEDGYHISYRHKKTSDDGSVRLDRDDRNGNGPETITINRISNSDNYTYKVHDYSNRDRRRSSDLANRSRATVRVYGDNQLLRTYRIDPNQRGTEWIVFRIENGDFVLVNQVD